MKQRAHPIPQNHALRVAAPVGEPDLPIASEVMSALPDPADPDQAVLVSTPVLTDELNYGDIVRLGSPDDLGIRPILGVVVASGHSHFLVATEPGDCEELIIELERLLPAHALRMARAGEDLFSISLHPDVDADTVIAFAADWLGVDAYPEDDELATAPAVGPLCETMPGPLSGPAIAR
jgi:hypothetical protein